MSRGLRAGPLAAAVAITGSLALAGGARAAPARRMFPATHPAWAQPSSGSATPSVQAGNVDVRVYLAGQDPQGLADFATEVSTPGSAHYGDYLTPAQLQAQYGPTGAQVSAVISWLTGAGLSVAKVDSDVGGYVEATGTLSAAQQAFGVTFGTFKGPDGKMDRAPTQAASTPSSVASDVLTITGLDTAKHQVQHEDTLPPPDPNYFVAGPTSLFYGQKIGFNEPTAYGHHQPWNVAGYVPRQIRGAYGVASSGMTGRGQTVAVVDAYASPTMLSDANHYARDTGDRPFRPGQYQEYLPSSYNTDPDECPDPAGWYGEESLDVESVHGEAPDADVRYVGSASCNDSDFIDALSLVVDHRLASIVSNSWDGYSLLDSAEEPVYDQIFKAGAVEGIGFFFATGDSGYNAPDETGYPADEVPTEVVYPASSPWVTAVGGTSVAIGRFNNYEFETSWGTMQDPLAADGTSWSSPPPGTYPDDYDGSSGGGVSTQYQQPFYQRGVVPDGLAEALPDGTISPTPMRVLPDVSALGDPSTGFLYGETSEQPDGSYAFSLSRIGGTSLATPTFAGIEADAQQAAGHPLGFVNPAIYARHGSPAFHDVTDHPFGPGVELAELRNNYTDPYTATGPIVTNLRTLGIDGEGADALPSVRGYDDATGVGSPDRYIQSFERFHAGRR
jgi:subtilase family serine protease